MFVTNNKFREKEIEMGNILVDNGYQLKEINDGENICKHDRYFNSDFLVKEIKGNFEPCSFKALGKNKAQLKAFAIRNIISKEIMGNAFSFEGGRVKVDNSYQQAKINYFYKIVDLLKANKSVMLAEHFKPSPQLMNMVKYGSQEIKQIKEYTPKWYIVEIDGEIKAYTLQDIFNACIVYKKYSKNRSHDVDITNEEGQALMLQFNIKAKNLKNGIPLEQLFEKK